MKNRIFKEALALQYVCETCHKFLFSEEDISNHWLEKGHDVHWIPIFKKEVLETLDWIKLDFQIPLTHYKP